MAEARFEAADTDWSAIVLERDEDGVLHQFAQANSLDGAKRLAKALNADA